MLRHTLLASAACAGAALWAGSVAAQTAESTATPPGPSAASPSTGNAPRMGQPATGVQLQEVVVTAEKRTSTAQKTAASVDVVSSDTLAKQNIVQLQDLNQVLPSVQIEPLVNSVQFAIRGVQSNFIDPRAEPAVAASVNGLFFDRPLPFGFAFLDVSRVEALNGPAGTLYGRNAAGGAINIITNQPTNIFGGTVSAQGGNLGANSFTGVVNLPVNDTLAVRVAYGRDRRDGYIGGLYDDIHTDTARLSIRWRPNEKLTVYLEGDYEHQGGAGTAQTYYPCNGAPAYSLVIPAGCERQLLGKAGLISRNGRTDSDVIAAQLHVDYDLGFATATSISGFVLTHQHFDFLPNGVLLTSERTHNYDYTQEFRLTGKDTANHQGGLAWQAGVFLFDSSGDFYRLSVTPFGNKVNQFPDLPQSSEAGFGQVTYGVTDRLRVTGGVRYTHDFRG